MKHSLALAGLALLSSTAYAQTLSISLFAGGFTQPVGIYQDPTNPNVQFVVQQGGTIRVVQNGVVLPTPFLTRSVLTGSERGLLGLAFAPDYATSGHFYINYTRSGPFMQLSRYTRSSNPLVADPASELRILQTSRPFSNHNAGVVAFGPDNLLYFPTGDGGSGNDPGNRSQTATTLLGKMLRIDPSGDDFPADPDRNYRIPADNPFVDGQPITALPEIWSFGLRNPWKISFDDPALLGTGAMLIADVGQGAFEEVSYEPANRGGRNYGWRVFEGFQSIIGGNLAYQPHQPPIFAYNRSFGASITGGFVYRGLQLGPEFFGRYFFGDFVLGTVYSVALTIDPVTGEATSSDFRNHTPDFGGVLGNVSSFGVDPEGEMFVVDYGGSIYRMNRPDTTWLTGTAREQGIFTGGQVRSLVLSDNRTLDVTPFGAFADPNRPTRINVKGRTNVANRTTLTLAVQARVNQAVSVPTRIELRNWATNQFVQVTTGNLTGTFTTLNATAPAADFVSANGEIEMRVATTYSGPLVQSRFGISYDRVTFSVQ